MRNFQFRGLRWTADGHGYTRCKSQGKGQMMLNTSKGVMAINEIPIPTCLDQLEMIIWVFHATLEKQIINA